jgi:hypothetical protein
MPEDVGGQHHFIVVVMLIIASDFAKVANAPQAVWARLQRGPEQGQW